MTLRYVSFYLVLQPTFERSAENSQTRNEQPIKIWKAVI